MAGPLARAFVSSSEALGQEVIAAGHLYPDELDPQVGRSRWTRQRALIELAGLGEAGPLRLVLQVQGWPADTLGAHERQPTVTVSANGQPVGTFVPSQSWADYELVVPSQLAGPDLRLLLETSSVFTATQSYPADNRPHGIRISSLSLAPAESAPRPYGPDLGMLVGGSSTMLLLYLALRRLGSRWWLAAALSGAVLVGLALLVSLARPYALPVVRGLLPLAGLALLLSYGRALGRLYRGLLLRLAASGALATGLLLALLLVAAGWLLPALRGFVRLTFEGLRYRDPEAISQVTPMLLVFSLALLVLMNTTSISQVVRRLQARLILGRWSLILLLGLLAIWLTYQWTVIRVLPYVGHADYADNAVVARNLLRGRGWVVDYVTQFYQLYPEGSVVRPQETWPLLQPVWILPFFALFGPQAWAAKIPNLIFNLLLALTLYLTGARLWDRRVGLLAALLTLTNQFFFYLTIFVTNDLGFALFATAASALFFVAHEQRAARLLLWSGLLTGLMCLQKPSGVLLAGGMGLWWLLRWRAGGALGWRPLLLRWVLPAALVLSPYLARNMLTFGSPFYSTESIDAWVLGFRGPAGWDDIYKVYTPELGPAAEGVPDRSWILRWGFERTYAKIGHQFAATRDYLLPPLPGLGPLSGRARLLGVVATWLALLGLLAAAQRRQLLRLLGLLLATFGPYILFLCLYWHADEERYFVPLVPWLSLFAAAALAGLLDLLARAWPRRGAALGAALAMLVLVLSMQQHPHRADAPTGWEQMSRKLEREPLDWAADIQAFTWLRDNTPPGTVVMTRVPWQLSFHADRPALMTPNTPDLQALLRLAQYYRAGYLLVGASTNEKDGAKQALSPLIAGQEAHDFAQVLSVPAPNNRTIYIYRFPADYGGVAEIKTP